MWDDFVADIEQVFEALDNFFENHWKPLLVLTFVFMIGMFVGYGMDRCENATAEQAEIYIETGGEEVTQ